MSAKRPRASTSTNVTYIDSASEEEEEGVVISKKKTLNKKRVVESEDEYGEDEAAEEEEEDDDEDEEVEDEAIVVEDASEDEKAKEGESDVEMKNGDSNVKKTIPVKSKKVIKIDTESEEGSDQDEGDEEDDEDLIDDEEGGAATAAKKPRLRQMNLDGNGVVAPTTKVTLDENLAPIIALPEMFADLVGKADGRLDGLVKKLDGRALRVATMCSGTESPLIALNLIARSLKEQVGSTFKIDHIFSCEIEPYKQAYIERNFSPPLLFRDVTELGEPQALTAYGGLADVPGEIDMLIAGTSCVDYSPLNGKKKKMDENGESGQTFFGMLDYVDKHKPAIVILENVAGAPWKDVVIKFAGIGYTANPIRVDTKQYYLPHTRVRGYLMAVPNKHASLPAKWEEVLISLRRSASVSLEAFLLPTDDPRIQRAREELGRIVLSKDGSKRAPTDWGKCESRHHRARDEEDLGQKRPLTDWQEAGSRPMLPDGGWNDWAAAQTERVLDLMDISVLRKAKGNIDIQYKSAMWELSQNVDRSTSSSALAICPCMTPNMIGYFAIRGGPITGLEALSLQGLPIEDLLLTRESENQLADFAGNAMTSTTVGAAILSALFVAGKTVASPKEGEAKKEDVIMKEVEVEKASLSESIRGESRLGYTLVDLTACSPLTPEFLTQAVQSARRCVCEARTDIAKKPISICKNCGHSSCDTCKSRPAHSYELSPLDRVDPELFEKEAKKVLPMRFQLDGFVLERLRKQVEELVESGTPVNQGLVESYLILVAETVDGAEFFFGHLTRRVVWTATYFSRRASLELTLDPKGLLWTLSVHPDVSLPANSPLRRFCAEPVGRLHLAQDSTNLIDGKWELHIPLSEQSIDIEIKNTGESVPSWRNSLGLPDYADEMRASRITISTPAESKVFMDQSIDGVYALESECGTACSSLHRRVEPASDIPLYFFLDPSRSGPVTQDGFVFAIDCARVEYGSARPIIASLDTHWRPNIKTSEQVTLKASAKWITLETSKIDLESMAAANSLTATAFGTPLTTLELSAGKNDCSFAENLLSAKVELDLSKNKWATPEWYQIDILHEASEVFDKVAWMLARSPELGVLKEWQAIKEDSLYSECSTCCPPPPQILWRKNTSRQVVAYESGIDACKFEQALKARPSPILVHTRQVDGIFEFRIGLNVASLAHKALATLPTGSFRSFPQSTPEVVWRLNPTDGVQIALKRTGPRAIFALSSNRLDIQASQPPHFKRAQLRPEQLRSLTWMIAQEKTPTPWVEEEVSEAILRQLGWHAEAKATRKVIVKGGVLADEVGYGKTAITLGLISAQHKSDKVPICTDRIPTKATLIIVPSHLTKQWPSEITKFTGKTLKTIVIRNVADLKRQTIATFQDSDIIVVSEALFKSAQYWPGFGDFTGAPRGVKTDENAGRYFRNCVEEALQALPAQLARLQSDEEGPKAVWDHIKTSRKARSTAKNVDDVSSKRLKGQALIFEQERLAELKKNNQKDTRKVKAVTKEKVEVKAENDPWSLQSKEVRKDWREMHTPHPSMFSFNRIVIDEYTYLKANKLVAVKAIRASSRWILSGTPPLKDFKEIQTIASLLHVDLGEHDQSDAQVIKESTAAEKFHSYRDVRTVGWHARRDGVAQLFLDRFARQNVAEIDEIPYGEEIVPIDLPAAEMAIYRELEHHLLALDSNLTKVVRMKQDKRADREVRLAQALGLSKSPEEALLKRCSHFSLDMDDEIAALENAPSVCDQILKRRVDQLSDCEKELVSLARTTAEMHRVLYKEFPNLNLDARQFMKWLNDIDNIGDDDAQQSLLKIAAKAGCTVSSVGKVPDSSKIQGLEEFLGLNKGAGKKLPASEYEKAKEWILRENVHKLRRLHKELLGRFRSKRYFQNVRDVQKGTIEGEDAKDLAILSCCGHTGTIDAVNIAARKSICVEKGCKAPVRATNVVIASTLGMEGGSGTFGKKLETLVALIDSIDPKSRILVFVQFEDLFDKVKEALLSYDVEVDCLKGSTVAQSNVLENFQDPEAIGKRVLLLQVAGASVAGANLTIADHAFFISPLLTENKEEYVAYETQAIGRLRRYGQTKPVKVIRLITSATQDVDVYESRTGLKVSEILASQKARVIIPTTRTLKKVSIGGEATAKGKGKAKAKNESDEEAEESEAEESDVPVKKVAKKGEAIVTVIASEEEEEEEVARPKKKATPAKVVPSNKRKVPDSDDAPIVNKKAKTSRTPKAPVKSVVVQDSGSDIDKVIQPSRVIAPPTKAARLTVKGTEKASSSTQPSGAFASIFSNFSKNIAKSNAAKAFAAAKTSAPTAKKVVALSSTKTSKGKTSSESFEGVVIEVPARRLSSSSQKSASPRKIVTKKVQRESLVEVEVEVVAEKEVQVKKEVEVEKEVEIEKEVQKEKEVEVEEIELEKEEVAEKAAEKEVIEEEKEVEVEVEAGAGATTTSASEGSVEEVMETAGTSVVEEVVVEDEDKEMKDI